MKQLPLDITWRVSSKPNLHPYDVHIWRILLPIKKNTKNNLKETLSPDEIARLAKFHFEKDRESNLVARGALRDILSRYLNSNPNKIQFHYTAFGKPYLNDTSLNFNVSHANNCILIAVANNMLVGIDVEYYKKKFDFLSIAQAFFTQNEYANLLNIPSEQRLLAFYQCWTQKEALLKGIGEGLNMPLNQFDVGNFFENKKIINITKKLKNNSQSIDWYLSNIYPFKGYIGALATSKPYAKILLWHWKKN